MRKPFLILTISLSLLLTGCGESVIQIEESDKGFSKGDNMVEIISKLELTSSAFEPGGAIPLKYTCDGEDVNPPLTISKVMGGASSLVLIVDDPDAPNGDWVHWLVWDIDPGTTEIAENRGPEGAIQGKTSFGAPGYGGPCPPSGTHRYFFKLYVLDKKLELDSSADKGQLLEAMEGHVLEQAELMGRYSRD